MLVGQYAGMLLQDWYFTIWYKISNIPCDKKSNQWPVVKQVMLQSTLPSEDLTIFMGPVVEWPFDQDLPQHLAVNKSVMWRYETTLKMLSHVFSRRTFPHWVELWTKHLWENFYFKECERTLESSDFFFFFYNLQRKQISSSSSVLITYYYSVVWNNKCMSIKQELKFWEIWQHCW